jgi:hypothetical protein
MPEKRPGGPLPGQTGTTQKNPGSGKGTQPAKPGMPPTDKKKK